MKITADTNVLVRALAEDHAEQSKAAQLALRKADIVALTLRIGLGVARLQDPTKRHR